MNERRPLSTLLLLSKATDVPKAVVASRPLKGVGKIMFVKFKGFAVCRLPWKSIQNFDELKSAKPIQARPDTFLNIGLKDYLVEKLMVEILRVLWRLKALHFTWNRARFYNIPSSGVLDSERVGLYSVYSPNFWKKKDQKRPFNVNCTWTENFRLATPSSCPFSRPIWGLQVRTSFSIRYAYIPPNYIKVCPSVRFK